MLPHEGDIGTAFRVTILDQDGNAVPLTGATTTEIKVEKPDGTTEVWLASVFGPATDGVLEYVTVSGDLDQDGQWLLQVFVVLPAGTWRSDTARFDVQANL